MRESDNTDRDEFLRSFLLLCEVVGKGFVSRNEFTDMARTRDLANRIWDLIAEMVKANEGSGDPPYLLAEVVIALLIVACGGVEATLKHPEVMGWSSPSNGTH